MIRKYLFYFLLFIFSHAIAQQRIVDSIYAVLKTEKEDTNKVKSLNVLSWDVCMQGQYKAADSLARRALQLDSVLGYKRGQLKSEKTIGAIYYMKDNYPEALKWLMRSLSTDKEMNNKPDMMGICSNIGSIFYAEGNYPEALKYHLQALKIASDIGDTLNIGSSEENIGIDYYDEGNYDEALKSYLEAMKIYEKISNNDGLASVYRSLGNVYEAQKRYSDAIEAQKQSLNMYSKLKNERGMGTADENIGNVYYDEGNYAEALEAFLKAREIFNDNGYKRGMGFAYIGIGTVYAKQKQYTIANRYIDSAVHIANEIGERNMAQMAYRSRATLDSSAGDYKAALQDYKSYIMYNDSLKNEENTKKIVSEQMNYEFDKKQAEEKAIQDKKDADTAAANKRQQIITGSVSVGLLLVLIFSGLLFNRFRIARKQKKIIEEQKELVEQKNKEVLDSITYAKRLQDAILPPLSIIEKYLPESFVLYKPKDIVAGDFYWMWSETTSRNSLAGEAPDDIILIAAADCTGHGVPGAMVSVVCSNALNRAVKEFKITEPGKILDKVRELVLETFSQRGTTGERSESDVQDGMDISLLAISRSHGDPFGQPLANSYEIQWSGAYNSLLYMQNGEMKEITADKQPIGKADNPKPFNTHALKMKKGDTLYLFTDGYADQFGGPKGKKFKYRQLQEKLVAMSHMPMEKQKQELEAVLEQWKGNLEQTDDICMVGIKV